MISKWMSNQSCAGGDAFTDRSHIAIARGPVTPGMCTSLSGLTAEDRMRLEERTEKAGAKSLLAYLRRVALTGQTEVVLLVRDEIGRILGLAQKLPPSDEKDALVDELMTVLEDIVQI
jgi:hypothetical protein